MELNLGLSLCWRFGVDKSHKGLIRASSIAGNVPTFREVEQLVVPEKVAALVRTSSLCAETEEEWRRKKEMQSLRRMETRRRRSEKQRETGSGMNSKEMQQSGQPGNAVVVGVKGKGAWEFAGAFGIGTAAAGSLTHFLWEFARSLQGLLA